MPRMQPNHPKLRMLPGKEKMAIINNSAEAEAIGTFMLSFPFWGWILMVVIAMIISIAIRHVTHNRLK